MIHQVKASAKDVECLKQLVKLQLSLLDYAAQHTQIDGAEVETHLKTPYSEQNAQKIVKWLDDHSSLHDALTKFSQHTDAKEKQDLVTTIHEDVNLLYNPCPQKLQASFQCDNRKPNPDPAWKCCDSLLFVKGFTRFGGNLTILVSDLFLMAQWHLQNPIRGGILLRASQMQTMGSIFVPCVTQQRFAHRSTVEHLRVLNTSFQSRSILIYRFIPITWFQSVQAAIASKMMTI
ncbi:MAG: hypothetical protein U0175_02770 [Caldilineaceae bacterium]